MSNSSTTEIFPAELVVRVFRSDPNQLVELGERHDIELIDASDHGVQDGLCLCPGIQFDHAGVLSMTIFSRQDFVFPTTATKCAIRIVPADVAAATRRVTSSPVGGCATVEPRVEPLMQSVVHLVSKSREETGPSHAAPHTLSITLDERLAEPTPKGRLSYPAGTSSNRLNLPRLSRLMALRGELFHVFS